jgi:hypothetical protein
MIELPDDELDKLFKKSVEELDPQFDPEDWNSLKKRLDAHDGKTAGGWLKKWWPLALLMLIIPIGFITYQMTNNEPEALPINREVAGGLVERGNGGNDNSANENGADEKIENKVVESKKPINKEKASPTKASAEKNIEPNKILRNKESRISKSSSKSSITDYQISKTLPRSQSKTGGVYLEPNRSKQEGGDGAFSFNKTNAVRSNQPVSENKAVADTEQNSNGQNVGEDEVRLLISAVTLSSRTLNWENQPDVPVVTFNAPAVAEAPAEQEKPAEDYAKWAVRLGYSPDLSSVGFKNFTKPGAAFSLLIEYGLSPRLYLQSGISWSQKDYYANASEYKLMEYVTKYNTPYAVDGECTMIEVPLGLRYNLIQKSQSKLFIGTGVSSYYAQKEKYKYHYAKYVYDQKPGWKGKTGWFLLSHINASVGYERSITKKLSLVAEPYIRIPVKGVGYGKVNLMTIGMWISLRYTPAFK